MGGPGSGRKKGSKNFKVTKPARRNSKNMVPDAGFMKEIKRIERERIKKGRK
jgi:hypothetical protein